MYRIAAALMVSVLGLPVAAGNAPAEDGTRSQKEQSLGPVGTVTGADRREVARTIDVYDPWEAHMLGQKYVYQYVFENDSVEQARQKGPGDYR